MRAKQTQYGTKLWISARETYAWAHKVGASWPCSQLADHRLFVEFDARGDLVDMAVDGDSNFDIDSTEFNAITSDFLRQRFGSTHPAIRS